MAPRKKRIRDKDLHARLRQFIRAKGADYLKDPNISSIGVGRKNALRKPGQPAKPDDGKICLVFTVNQKISADPQPADAEAATESLNTRLARIGTREIAPRIEIIGPDGETVDVEVLTDVEERTFEASHTIVAEAADAGPRRSRVDPVYPGISVSHPTLSAGTLGLIVFDRLTGAPCILSNWHVLHGAHGQVGDTVVQPGPHDDNAISVNQCGTLLRSHLGAAGDCALARIRGRDLDPLIHELGVTARRMADVELDDPVVKSGRTTGVTHGKVTRVDVMVSINYPGAGDQSIGCFEVGLPDDTDLRPADGEVSRGGDSGSAWLIADGAQATDILAGLHFAGETGNATREFALACYPASVQSKLGFVLAPDPDAQTGGAESTEAVPRSGYDPDFLGVAAPMPGLTHGQKIDAVNFGTRGGRVRQTIPYTHFEVCQSARHRLARFVAWNIDGTRRVSLGRHGFRTDDRIPRDVQTDNSLYSDNRLDRGHIARRADLAWGPVEEARQANRDSFFYTNIAPQHERFNQSGRGGLWGRLENLVLEQADAQDIRVSVLAGPIFHDDDPVYRGTKIPREYWKLIAYRAADDCLTAAAFLLSQSDMLSSIEALDFDPFRLFRIDTGDLAARTGLDFAAYGAADVMQNPSRASFGGGGAEALETVSTGLIEVADEAALVF